MAHQGPSLLPDFHELGKGRVNETASSLLALQLGGRSGGLDAAQFEDSGECEVLLRPGTPKERRIGGQAYLLSYGLPQFFFHVTTAYDLLRHNGVEIGKKDYMGAY